MKFLKANGIYLLVLLPAIYFAIFLHLDSLPFRTWDESYLGVHTYEMMENHDYLVTHTFGSPEMVNTKPPFVIWCMVLSSKILGFSELSLRIPNALAGVAICLLLFFFISRILGSPLTGFLSVFILISSTGFIKLHVTRSGEYDAFLMLFSFIFYLCFFLLLENPGTKTTRWLWLGFTLAVIGAILTKGIAGVLAVPGLFIYALIQKKLPWLIRSKETYISIFFILLFGLGYYFLREHFNPGYLKAVNENELGGRYIKTNEGHSQGFFYYWGLIASEQFLFVMPLVLIGIFRAFMNDRKNRLDQMVMFCVYMTLPFILVLSISATKLPWYDAPIVPLIAVIGGYGFYTVFDFLFGISESRPSFGKVISMAAFAMVIIGPAFGNIIMDNMHTSEFFWDKEAYSPNYYIKKMEGQKVNMNGYKVLLVDQFMVRAQMCQIKKLELKGQKLEIADIAALKAGDKVITSNDNMRNQIDGRFSHKELDSSENIAVWQLTEPNANKAQ